MRGFPVGTIVQVVDDSATTFVRGERLTIIENDRSSIPYYCRNDEGETEWMREHELELVSTVTDGLAERVGALEDELAQLKESLREMGGMRSGKR